MSISKTLLCSWPLSWSSIPTAESTVQFSVYLNQMIVTILTMSNNKLEGLLIGKHGHECYGTRQQHGRAMLQNERRIHEHRVFIILVSGHNVQNRIGQTTDHPCRHKRPSGSPVATRSSCTTDMPHQTKSYISPVQTPIQTASYSLHCRNRELV